MFLIMKEHILTGSELLVTMKICSQKVFIEEENNLKISEMLNIHNLSLPPCVVGTGSESSGYD